MLRGTLVIVNDKVKPPHLKGTVGIVVGRSSKTGHIEVYSEYEGYTTNIYYPEECLEVLEAPKEL